MADGAFFQTPEQALAAEQQMRQAQALQQGFTPLGASAQELGRSLAGAFGSALGAPVQESPEVQLARTRSQAVKMIDPSRPGTFTDAASELYKAGDLQGATTLLSQAKALQPESVKYGIQEIKGEDEEGNSIYQNYITANGLPIQLFSTGPRKVSGTTVQNILGSDDFYASLGKELGKKTVEDYKNAQSAADSLRSSSEAINILDSGIITGTGATFILNVGKALKQAGLYEGEALSNTEAFFANQGKQVMALLSTGALGAGTGISEKDLEFARKVAGAQENLTEEALRKIIDLNNQVSKNMVNNFNKRAKTIDATGKMPFTLEVPIPEVRKAEIKRADISKATRTALNPNTEQVIYEIDGKWVDEFGNEVK